jgi:GT2 family glycosyltransferase
LPSPRASYISLDGTRLPQWSRAGERQLDADVPTVAVVIPTFERAPLLARTLEALALLDVPPGGLEVVVVDDGSSADHAAGVAAAVDRLANARLLTQPNAGPAAARNRGWRSSGAPLIAFLDDDCTPARDWLTVLVAALTDAEQAVGAVGGRVLSAPTAGWVARFCAATEYATGIQPVFENAATANACYRRHVLEELGGFDESFVHPGGDDPDLSARARAAGYTLRFVPEAVVYHVEFDSYGDYVVHMYRRGLGEVRVAEKQGRRWWVAARVALAPVYIARTAGACWRRTAGKASAWTRLGWVGLESVGRAAFLAGTVRNLLRS